MAHRLIMIRKKMELENKEKEVMLYLRNREKMLMMIGKGSLQEEVATLLTQQGTHNREHRISLGTGRLGDGTFSKGISRNNNTKHHQYSPEEKVRHDGRSNDLFASQALELASLGQAPLGRGTKLYPLPSMGVEREFFVESQGAWRGNGMGILRSPAPSISTLDASARVHQSSSQVFSGANEVQDRNIKELLNRALLAMAGTTAPQASVLTMDSPQRSFSSEVEQVSKDLVRVASGKTTAVKLPTLPSYQEIGSGSTHKIGLPLRKRKIDLFKSASPDASSSSAPSSHSAGCKHVRKKLKKRANNKAQNGGGSERSDVKRSGSPSKPKSRVQPPSSADPCADKRDKNRKSTETPELQDSDGSQVAGDMLKYAPSTKYYYSGALAESDDETRISEYQCELRKHLELFEAEPKEARESSTPGRKGKVIRGQIGLRCRHCARLSPRQRSPGAANYSHTVEGCYQIAQNIGKAHLRGRCVNIPQKTKAYLNKLHSEMNRSRMRNCKEYWTSSIRQRGIIEISTQDGVQRLMRH